MAAYVTHNDRDIDVDGTSLQGYVDASYDMLVAAFGQPMPGTSDHKTDAEWYVEFPGGVVATIYNWKNGPAYLGPSGIPVDKINQWNVGGHRASCVDLVAASCAGAVAESL